MKEEEFRQQVRRIARMYGWTMQYHTHNSVRSDPGWPDETWINKERKRIIFIELKSDKGRIRPAQQEWIDGLKLCGLEAAIWRPRDVDLIVEVLGPKQRSLLDPDFQKPIPTDAIAMDDDGWVFSSEMKKDSKNAIGIKVNVKSGTQ